MPAGHRSCRGWTGREAPASSLAQLLAPRDRLAAAMMGDDVGQPVTAPVNLGDVQLSAAEFESLVAEMRKTHMPRRPRPIRSGPAVADNAARCARPRAASSCTKSAGSMASWATTPATSVVSLRPAIKTPSCFKANATESDSSPAIRRLFPITRGIDWAARQLAFAVDGDMAYVSNRFQVAAFDLKEGRRTWQSGVGGEHARTHDWTLTPMRPAGGRRSPLCSTARQDRTGAGRASEERRTRCLAHSHRFARRLRSAVDRARPDRPDAFPFRPAEHPLSLDVRSEQRDGHRAGTAGDAPRKLVAARGRASCRP